MSQRIKQIRKKTSSGYTTGIPIGTDGILVDMLSGFDLEEELKLGNNHYVEILETEESTLIKEWYYDAPKEENDNENNVLYYVETTITSSENGDTITCVLYKGNKTNTNNDIILHRKIISINETTVSQTETKTEINEEVS